MRDKDGSCWRHAEGHGQTLRMQRRQTQKLLCVLQLLSVECGLDASQTHFPHTKTPIHGITNRWDSIPTSHRLNAPSTEHIISVWVSIFTNFFRSYFIYISVTQGLELAGSCEHGNETSGSIKGRGISWLFPGLCSIVLLAG
jgi:hypothetical protein